jgi:hypothetical protein
MRLAPAPLVAACAAIVVVVAGCAGSSSTDSASDQLRRDVLALTQDAHAGNIPAARSELRTLRRHVHANLEAGRISATKARQLRGDIAAVRADLDNATAARSAAGSSSAAPASTVATSHHPPAGPSKPVPSGHQNNNGKGNGHTPPGHRTGQPPTAGPSASPTPTATATPPPPPTSNTPSATASDDG